MQTEKKFRLVRKLLMLMLLLGGLTLLSVDTRPVAAGPTCDFQYSMCQSGCQNQWPQDYSCYYGCDIAYDTCIMMGG